MNSTELSEFRNNNTELSGIRNNINNNNNNNNRNSVGAENENNNRIKTKEKIKLILKVIIFIICSIFLSIQSYQLFSQYLSGETVVSMIVEVLKYTKIPAITICY